jgi:hypothetical protein
MAPVSLPIFPKGDRILRFVRLAHSLVIQKIQGRRADDFDRARNQDLGLQRQVGGDDAVEAGPVRPSSNNDVLTFDARTHSKYSVT